MAAYKTYLFVVLVSILVIGIVAAATRYQRDLSAARERIIGLGSQVIETDCGTIEYARVGEGYPVLVVHGFMGGFDQGTDGGGISRFQIPGYCGFAVWLSADPHARKCRF